LEILTTTLLADGSSDRALLPIIAWTLQRHVCRLQVSTTAFADLTTLAEPPSDLTARIRSAIASYPCDLLFIHRDAEGQPPGQRYAEIRNAISGIVSLKIVSIVPQRMTEAWLLIDEQAIRQAAGNPNGKSDLKLPPRKDLVHIPDPKAALDEALCATSELKGRRLSRFSRDLPKRRHLVAQRIASFSALLQLETYQQFSRDARAALHELGIEVSDDT
jgi:hypothetical protein